MAEVTAATGVRAQVAKTMMIHRDGSMHITGITDGSNSSRLILPLDQKAKVNRKDDLVKVVGTFSKLV